MSKTTQITQSGEEIVSSPRLHRRWCFTLNNYTNDEIHTFKIKLEDYILGYEVGASGTPHIQGYCEFKNARSFESMQKICPRAHFLFTKRSKRENLVYCSKEGKYEIMGMKVPDVLWIITELLPWQLEIENIIKSIPDRRTIHWYWEEEGCRGKTQLLKYLLFKYTHVEFARCEHSSDICTLADIEKTAYIIDFPRDVKPSFSPWNALEQLKDGLISDAKMKKKCRNVLMNSPHVIVFANWPPEMGFLSKDKLKITHLAAE